MIQVIDVLNRCDSCDSSQDTFCISTYKEGLNESSMFLCPSCFAELMVKYKGAIERKVDRENLKNS